MILNKKNLVFFVLFSCQVFALEGSNSLSTSAYVNSEDIKALLKKMEQANVSKANSADQTQKELEEIQKKVNLSNERRTLENAEASMGNNPDNIRKRVKSLQDYYKETTSLEDFIYSDSFNYQSICKGTNCIVSALVEAEVFKEKMTKLTEKISSDKVVMAKSLQNVYPLEDKISLVKQAEQTTYSTNQLATSFSNNTLMTTDETKKKKYLEVVDGDILGNIKVTVTPNYIKLSKNSK